ncbi:hypothetical protein N7528_005386 [Penicillium herquei]|nr:hypothetical protein N7528_005386 [Penicillium herquei]
MAGMGSTPARTGNLTVRTCTRSERHESDWAVPDFGSSPPPWRALNLDTDPVSRDGPRIARERSSFGDA